jgi:hypothetical protein
MATNTQKRNPDTKRQVLYVPLNVCQLLTLVANYQFRTKGSLAEEIWRAGLCAHLGLRQEDIDTLIARPLLRGTQPPERLNELVQALIKEV